MIDPPMADVGALRSACREKLTKLAASARARSNERDDDPWWDGYASAMEDVIRDLDEVIVPHKPPDRLYVNR